MQVDSIFDRISMGLVFGLDENNPLGYVGIFVIIEHLTQYLFAKPIKSKSSEEIASCLLEYITLFGPPRQILSDRGTEFCNDIVKSMLNLSGIDKIVTSSYNPAFNGKTEKFNDTLIIMLRKVVIDRPNWHHWFNFCLMAYRSRIHPFTGYSPYELMFGTKMNVFNDFSTNNDLEFGLMFNQRVEQIRNLIDIKQPRATLKTGR
jgi:hypothetical protein